MTNWPNWVDAVVVIIITTTCYKGFGRGVLGEVLNLAGAVATTILTLDYAGIATGPVRQWGIVDPLLFGFIAFWAVFFAVLLTVHVLVRSLTQLVKWEPFHWVTRSLGLAVGGLRGLWWSGVILLALTSSGFVYLRESVEERSMVGPRLVTVARERLEQILDWVPGGMYREPGLFPAFKPGGGRRHSE